MAKTVEVKKSTFHDFVKIRWAPFGHRMGTDLSYLVGNAVGEAIFGGLIKKIRFANTLI